MTEKPDEIINNYMESLEAEASINQVSVAIERAIRRAFISGMQSGIDIAKEISKEVHSK